MMNYIRQTPSEECPLTKEKANWSLNDCCGFRAIICSFIGLTVVITLALVLQLVYDDDTFQGNLNIHGAVATDYTNCSQIGTKILRKGGNALDAAIAATLCMSVVAPHKASLGSGGYIMLYNHKDQEEPIIIDFLNNLIPDEFEKNKIRIPALLRGLEYAHKYIQGKLPWQDLVEPSINLAKNGFEISRDYANEATKNSDLGSFGSTNAGEILKIPKLASTLQIVSQFGADAFYNGTLSSRILSNYTNNDKLFNELASYEPSIMKAEKSILSQFAIFYPSTTNYAQLIIEEMNKLNISKENASSIESEIKTAETIIKLMRQLNNPYIKYTEARKYTGVSAVDWQDTYVTIITGLGSHFDVNYETEAGFAFDSITNQDALLSFTPIIFHDETAVCGLRGVFSSDDAIVAGQILYNLILRSMNVSLAVEYARYYVLSDGITVEKDERQSSNRLLHDSLLAIDKTSTTDVEMIMKSVNVIIKRKNLISGHSDSRGDGLASRF
ncbi:hypothetical protein TKK_0017390 [Trichogramma kaykai]